MEFMACTSSFVDEHVTIVGGLRCFCCRSLCWTLLLSVSLFPLPLAKMAASASCALAEDIDKRSEECLAGETPGSFTVSACGKNLARGEATLRPASETAGVHAFVDGNDTIKTTVNTAITGRINSVLSFHHLRPPRVLDPDVRPLWHRIFAVVRFVDWDSIFLANEMSFFTMNFLVESHSGQQTIILWMYHRSFSDGVSNKSGRRILRSSSL